MLLFPCTVGCIDGSSCPPATSITPVTCPGTERPTDCPIVTCPPPHPPVSSGVSLSLTGISYSNNSIILIEGIGEAENGLFCTTDRVECCSGANRAGSWYFPDGHEILPGFLAVSDIYQNRGPQIVRLNRRNGVQSPSGKYRCEIPDANGTTQELFVTIMPSTGIYTCTYFSARIVR